MLIEYYKWYSLCKKPIKGIIHGKIQVTNEGDTPFRPVGRKIQIIRNDVRFNDKRVLPRVSLSHINPNILSN